MRKRFEQQTTLGILPISEVKINTKSRDELPPVLVALQQIFVTEELIEKIFLLLEDKIINCEIVEHYISALSDMKCSSSYVNHRAMYLDNSFHH